MNKYKISIVDRNSYGDVVRCPNCGQVLFILNALDGEMKVTAQCRRCHSFTEVETESDEVKEHY